MSITVHTNVTATRCREKRPARVSKILLAAGAAALSLSRVSDAANKTWVVNSGNWSGTFNWSPAGAPADFDNVSFFGANGFSKTVTYDINDGFLHVFGNIGIQSAGQGQYELRQPGTSLEASLMSIAGTAAVNGRARHVLTAGGTAFVGETYMGDLSTLSVGAGCGYHVGDLTQDNGTLTIDPAVQSFTVGGEYLFRGGTNSGPMRIESTGKLNVQAATVGAAIDNFGALDITTNTNFTSSLTNRASFTILGPRVITAERWDQRGGDITQFGETRGTYYTVQGGATWTLFGGIHQGTQIATGSAAGDGSYVMLGGSVNMNGFSTARIIVGMENHGEFLQSGGSVRVPFLYIGGSGSLGSGSGYYKLSGTGSLTCTGLMWVGTDNAQGGIYEQTAGSSTIQRFIVNENSTSSGEIRLSGGSMLVNTSSENNGAWNQTGGTARIDGFLDGNGAVNVSGNGVLSLARLRQNSLHVGGTARVLHEDFSITQQVNRVNSIVFEEVAGQLRGTYDLDNSSLAIDYAPGASPIASVKRYLASGFADGAWTGTGLSSSLAGVFNWALGVAEASDVLGPAGGNFRGLTVDGSTVLVDFTRYGDANVDGFVNAVDFSRLATNFGTSGKSWSQGDFNYDGFVNAVDFSLLATNFGMSATGTDGEVTPEDWANLAVAVPEPGSFLLGAITASLAIMRPRRRRSRPA